MLNSTKPIDHATPLDDISGLKLPNSRVFTLQELYVYEANNIALAMLKYLVVHLKVVDRNIKV